MPGPTKTTLAHLEPRTVLISSRQKPGCKHNDSRPAMPASRRRGADQAPQTTLRAGRIPSERGGGPSDLD
jgi:hypothetical protein